MSETTAPSNAKRAAGARPAAGREPPAPPESAAGANPQAGSRAQASAGASTGQNLPQEPARPRLNRFVIPLAIFVGLVIVLAVGIMNSRTVGVIQSPLIGKHAPAWSLPVLDQAGRTFGSKDLAGKWYVLNVWGSWCYACKDEHPELLAISRSSSVPIIGIDWNDSDAQARDYLNTLGNPYETITTDHDGHVVIDWGVYGAPETFLVNPAGVVVYKQIGAMTAAVWQKEFASRLPHDLTGRTPAGPAS